MSKPKVDIGLVWAKFVNTYGQVGAVAGVVQMLSTLAILYTTTIQPNIDVPIWLYILIIVSGAMLMITFVLKIGISGYYRFFSKQSEVGETNRRVQETDRKLELIMAKLGIEDNGKESQ
jgi:hypothetical protein